MQKALSPSLALCFSAQASTGSQADSGCSSLPKEFVFQVQRNERLAHTLELCTLGLCQFKYESFLCRCGQD